MSKYRLPDNAYFEDRPVRHHAQGDFYDDVPFYVGTVRDSSFHSEGDRTRPSFPEPDAIPWVGLGVICSYTCGFMSQPANQSRGYGHPFRLMAPVWTLDHLTEVGLEAKDRRSVMQKGVSHGLMYTPHPKTGEPSVVVTYRMSLVRAEALPEDRRVARFSEAAQRILMTSIIHVVSPTLFTPYPRDPGAEDYFSPDLSDGWPNDEPTI